MARRAESTFWIIKGVNDLLFDAWEHGARHIALNERNDGTEIRFLGADGGESIEHSPLPYRLTVQRLHQMSARTGGVRVNAAGQHWQFQVVFPDPHRREAVFLHLHREE